MTCKSSLSVEIHVILQRYFMKLNINKFIIISASYLQKRKEMQVNLRRRTYYKKQNKLNIPSLRSRGRTIVLGTKQTRGLRQEGHSLFIDSFCKVQLGENNSLLKNYEFPPFWKCIEELGDGFFKTVRHDAQTLIIGVKQG